MAEKIRIIRALANPITRRKKKTAKRRRTKKARATRRPARAHLVRAFVMKGSVAHVEWWTGKRWRHGKNHAARYKGEAAAREALQASKAKCPRGCVAIEVLPV